MKDKNVEVVSGSKGADEAWRDLGAVDEPGEEVAREEFGLTEVRSSPLPQAVAEAPRMTMDPVDEMDWSGACRVLLIGWHVSRKAWDDPAVFLAMVNDTICIHKADGIWYPLTVSSGDMMGADWTVVGGRR